MPDDEDVTPAPEPTPIRGRKREEEPHPLAQVETPEQLHGRVRFTRSLQVGTNRNDQAHYSLEMEYAYPPEADLAAIAEIAAGVFFQTKAVIYEQAGLDMELDQTGILREVVRQSFQPSSSSRSKDDDDQGSDDRFPQPADMTRPDHVKADLWRDLCNEPGNWYDNRPDKASGRYKSSSPDFKHKDSGEAIWLQQLRRSGSR